MKSLITYDAMFWCASSLIVAGLVVWTIYEAVQCFKSKRPDILPPPRVDRIARGNRDGWTFEVRTIKGDWK